MGVVVDAAVAATAGKWLQLIFTRQRTHPKSGRKSYSHCSIPSFFSVAHQKKLYVRPERAQIDRFGHHCQLADAEWPVRYHDKRTAEERERRKAPSKKKYYHTKDIVCRLDEVPETTPALLQHLPTPDQSIPTRRGVGRN